MTQAVSPPVLMTSDPPNAVALRRPSIGLVLGGGGARGLAHILMLEVFDELGIKPSIIAGTSIGAIFGAAYASGLSAAEIRAHTLEALTRRFDLIRGLVAARAQGTGKLWNLLAARAQFLAPEALLDLVLPKRVARDFDELAIPLRIVASDYYALEAAIFSVGPLRPAIAASMALPVIFEPVEIDGRTLIDGGLTNPLPFDILKGEADVIVAIDVSGVTVLSAKRTRPTALESLFGASFLFERSIVREKLKSGQPDIYIDAGTGRYQALEFLKVREILAAAEPAKAQLRIKLERVLSTELLTEIGPDVDAIEEASAERRAKRPRRLLKGFKR
jgi:NTE family protein